MEAGLSVSSEPQVGPTKEFMPIERINASVPGVVVDGVVMGYNGNVGNDTARVIRLDSKKLRVCVVDGVMSGDSTVVSKERLEADEFVQLLVDSASTNLKEALSQNDPKRSNPYKYLPFAQAEITPEGIEFVGNSDTSIVAFIPGEHGLWETKVLHHATYCVEEAAVNQLILQKYPLPPGSIVTFLTDGALQYIISNPALYVQNGSISHSDVVNELSLSDARRILDDSSPKTQSDPSIAQAVQTLCEPLRQHIQHTVGSYHHYSHGVVRTLLDTMQTKLIDSKAYRVVDDATVIFAITENPQEKPEMFRPLTPEVGRHLDLAERLMAQEILQLPDEAIDILTEGIGIGGIMKLIENDKLVQDDPKLQDIFESYGRTYRSYREASLLSEVVPAGSQFDKHSTFVDFIRTLSVEEYKEIALTCDLHLDIKCPRAHEDAIKYLDASPETIPEQLIDLYLALSKIRRKDTMITQLRHSTRSILHAASQIERQALNESSDSVAESGNEHDIRMLHPASWHARILGRTKFAALPFNQQTVLRTKYGKPVSADARINVHPIPSPASGFISCADIERTLRGINLDYHDPILLFGNMMVFDTNGHIYYAITDKLIAGKNGGMIFPDVLYTIPRWLRLKFPLRRMARMVGIETPGHIDHLPSISLKVLRGLGEDFRGDDELTARAEAGMRSTLTTLREQHGIPN